MNIDRELSRSRQIEVWQERLMYGEKLSRETSLIWTLETMKHIALFCGAGAAASFTAMQVPSISMPLMQSVAGLFFLTGFCLSVYHLHVNAEATADFAKQLQKRWEESLNPNISLDYLGSPIGEQEVWEKIQRKVKSLGWFAAACGLAGACLLVFPVIAKETWKLFA